MVWKSPWKSSRSHAVPKGFQRIIVPDAFLTKGSVRTIKACLAPGLHHSLEARHGNRQLHFSIPDTTFLGINCPDAWVLRPQRCPVKTHWVARREARERRMIPAEQPFQRTGCHQKSQKASVLSLLCLGDWHLSACAQRSSNSGTVSIPGCMWGTRACKEDPLQTQMFLFISLLLPWGSCHESKSIWFTVFADSSGKNDPLFTDDLAWEGRGLYGAKNSLSSWIFSHQGDKEAEGNLKPAK